MSLTIFSKVRLNNGVEMPLLGLGTADMPQGAVTQRAVLAALEAGYRLIDTAEAYGSEKDIGSAIADSAIDRRDIFLTSKVWMNNQTHERTIAACYASLKRLQTDYLDLYLIHWPAPGRWPDAWRAMLTLLDDGVCRAIGVSNFTIRLLDELADISPITPAVNQVELTPFLFRRDLLDYCRGKGIQPEAYSPLTIGQRLHDPMLQTLAQKYRKTPAQLLLRWQLQHNVVAIPKSTNPQHIRENAAIFDFVIAPDDMQTLDTLDENYFTVSEDWRERYGT